MTSQRKNIARQIVFLLVPWCAVLVGGIASAADVMRFQFAKDAPRDGFTQVASDARYDASRGYGFEPGGPTIFSVKVPAEGNYRVTVTFGSAEPAETTVKAEARRLMLARVPTAGGQTTSRSFVVNVRTRAIDTVTEVRLNPRELATATWDDKLSLEVLSTRPSLQRIEIEPAPEAVTLYLAGDSTVTDQADEPWCGWGQMIPRFFKPTVAVANYAESGRSLRSFRADRRLDKILSVVRPCDYLFIQFGHNDQKEKGEGIGALTSYKKDLERYVDAAIAKGVTPVLVTPMYRRRFSSDGQPQDTLGDYPLANRQVAAERGLVLIDLHALSGKFLAALGSDASARAFVHYPAGTFPGQDRPLKDDTHFNAYGGYELARCVVEAIRTSTLPLASGLAEDVRSFDPSHPDSVDVWTLPASAARATQTPEGS